MRTGQSFPFAPSSVTKARHFAVDRLAGLPAPTLEAVALMVSELATNCIRHAQTGFELGIDIGHDQVRIEIADAGKGRPAIKSPQPSEPSGRGLRMVELLAENWGVISANSAQGKTVWFSVLVDQPERRLQGVQ